MDAFARWFGILRELGEVVDVKVLHFDSIAAGPTRTWTFPHEQYDGAGMVERVLGDLGTPLDQLPRIRESKPPAFFERLAALWREVREAREPAVPWRHFDPSTVGSVNAPFAYALFEREESAALSRRASERGATPNSFLLWALDRAVYDVVATPSHVHRWALPVNLRGAVAVSKRLANVASAISVRITDDAEPDQVKNTIRAQLERRAHWGVWDAFRLLGFLGEGAMRRYAAKYYARRDHSWVGIFSNVGPFQADAGWICGAPPVTRSHPISAAAVNMGGRLSLGMQIHPALGHQDVAGVMQRWRSYAEGTGR